MIPTHAGPRSACLPCSRAIVWPSAETRVGIRGSSACVCLRSSVEQTVCRSPVISILRMRSVRGSGLAERRR